MHKPNRRDFVKLGLLGAISVELAGCDVLLSPKEAKEQGARYRSLSSEQIETLERLGDILLPGAASDGIAHFIDAQITQNSSDCLSILRYMDWPPPYAQFYALGLKALDQVSQTMHGSSFSNLDGKQANDLIKAMSTGEIAWDKTAPPAPLFYFVLRSDAVDVVYGTMDGFKRLDVPYLAHIEPKKNW